MAQHFTVGGYPNPDPHYISPEEENAILEAEYDERTRAGGAVMNIIDIWKMPTIITEIPQCATGVHESCLRSYHILIKAKELLALGTPPGVVLDLIEEMEAPVADQKMGGAP
jgi:hypothetical protein